MSKRPEVACADCGGGGCATCAGTGRDSSRFPSQGGKDDRDRKREHWRIEPMQTAVIRRCPDERCGENLVTPVPHPDDPTQTPNRCPTCLGTVAGAREQKGDQA